jgi:hypothetical protein
MSLSAAEEVVQKRIDKVEDVFIPSDAVPTKLTGIDYNKLIL